MNGIERIEVRQIVLRHLGRPRFAVIRSIEGTQAEAVDQRQRRRDRNPLFAMWRRQIAFAVIGSHQHATRRFRQAVDPGHRVFMRLLRCGIEREKFIEAGVAPVCTHRRATYAAQPDRRLRDDTGQAEAADGRSEPVGIPFTRTDQARAVGRSSSNDSRWSPKLPAAWWFCHARRWRWPRRR